MKSIMIGKTSLNIKDYECSNDGVYLPKDKLRLWLYVNMTDACPATCQFCVHAASKSHEASSFDVDTFGKTLKQIAPYVSGISLTGGEPMLNVDLIESVINIIRYSVSPDIELDMVSNGLNINMLPNIKGIDRFATIHISRHAVDDQNNRHLMNWSDAPSAYELKHVFASLKDPGLTVLNCVLQKNGVHDQNSALEYLEFASEVGAANVSFIGMFMANDYCRNEYVSPVGLSLGEDPRVNVWNHFRDHDYCQCSTGDYHAEAGWIRYYYRCPGKQQGPDYCRQLVYGTDNLLRTGFGNSPVIIL